MGQSDREFNDAELRLLRFLWKQGRATLGQVVEALHPQPPLAVQRAVDGLVHDGFVTCDRAKKEPVYAVANDAAAPARPADPTQPRPVPRFLGGVFGQIAPAAGVMAAAGAAVAGAAAKVAQKAVSDAAAATVANAAATGGKVFGNVLKAAGKAALSKVTGAKKADQLVEQIADTAADIGKQVSDTVGGVVSKIVTEAMKNPPAGGTGGTPGKGG